MLRAWMADTGSKRWSVGLNFVQWQKNSSHHRTIGRSPYKALFGCDPKLGLSTSNIPQSLTQNLRSEEDVQNLVIDDNNNLDDVNNHDNNSRSDNNNTATMTTSTTYEHECRECGSVFDSRYSVNCDVCNLCHKETSIQQQRADSKIRMVAAAEKMLSSTKRKLPKYKIGDCVLLSVPKVDRGPSDPQNIVCVITDQKEEVNQPDRVTD
ncbi:uncharacterized protein LOC130664671 [Microplitis mediator]|uniref:uncharacterized protein LOC130664671 n=1 Tax=Microplitis mediator TaxID=375433 RepID=UPI002554E303|nr:uncharacterized protein LOC130664671 [Microplitis mediator]